MTPTDKTLKKFTIQYFVIICLICLLHIITNYLLGLYSLAYSFLIAIIFHLLLYITVFRLRFIYIKPFVFIYLSTACIILYFLITACWKNVSVVFIWLFTIPIAVKCIYQSKSKLLYWSIFVLIIAVLAIITPDKYVVNFPFVKNDFKIKFWTNVINIVTFTIMLIFLIYSEYRIEESKNNTDFTLEEKDKKNSFYIDLFSKIEEYFEINKPWKNPNFKLTDLSIAINSNNTYVSNAINYCSGVNFNIFVNKYRIDFIKQELIEIESFQQIKNIYLEAGFKQQTTFNKAFKYFEKTTPSEFIIEFKKNKTAP